MNTESASQVTPFVGLRAFDTTDEIWFFGRDRETTELARKLRDARFTAVVGPSGSGKSSVVRAGVVPRLKADGWKEIITKPGSAPLSRLAHALAASTASERLFEACRFRFDASLRASAFGLAEIAKNLAPDAPRILLIVDQFEELFRFGEDSTGAVRAAMQEEARAFVELLLAASRSDEGRMHICVTMRSDYFGSCSKYVGLAETVSASQFLVPLPLRQQLEEAIRGPVALAHAEIEEGLIQRLLVDVVEESDQLPLLQHTLRRLWEQASGEPRTMRQRDYVAVGAISGSIDKKAEAVLSALGSPGLPAGAARDQATLDCACLQRVMKALTDLDQRGRATRRPQKQSELLALVQDALHTERSAASASLTRVLDALKSEDASFLQFGDGDDPEIDIGHEALIRSWNRLSGPRRDFSGGWLHEERKAGERWRGFVQRADEDQDLSTSDRTDLARWLRLGSVWSQRYGNQFEAVKELTTRSRRKSAIRFGAVAVGVIVLCGAVVLKVSEIYYHRASHNARLNALSLADRARAAAKDGDSRLAALLATEALAQPIGTSDQDRLPVAKNSLFDALARPIEIERLSVNPSPKNAFFNHDGSRIIAYSDTGVHEWDTKNYQPVDVPLTAVDIRIAGVASGSDGRQRVVTFESPNTVGVWNTSTGALGQMGDAGSCKASVVAVSSDGGAIVAVPYIPPPKHRTAKPEWAARVGEGGPTDSPAKLDTPSPPSDRLGLWRWDVTTGTLTKCAARGNAIGVTRIFVSAGGDRVLSLSKELPATAFLWDGRTGRLIRRLDGNLNSVILSAAFAPDNLRLVTTASDQTLQMWDAETGQKIGSPIRGHTGSVNAAAFSPDGLRIASASDDNTVRLWDAITRQPIGSPIRGNRSSVLSVAFSPEDGRYVVSASDDGYVRVWDVGSSLRLGTRYQVHTQTIWRAALSNDGTRIVSASDDQSVGLWDAKSGRLIADLLQGHDGAVFSAAFSPDGQQIVSASADHTLRRWNATDGTPIGAPMRGHRDWVYSAAYSPDGRFIVSASNDETLRIWDASTGLPLGVPLRGHGEPVNSASFSSDGKLIVSASNDKTIRVWDAANRATVGDPIQGSAGGVRMAVFSPNGRYIASASADKIYLWDAISRQPVFPPLDGHAGTVNTLAFSHDGSRIVSASDDRTIRLWDAATGKPIGEPFTGHRGEVESAAFSEDDEKIVSASADRTIRIWDVNTGRSVAVPPATHVDAVLSAAFVGDGAHIVSASADGTLRLWNAEKAEPIGEPLAGHTDEVNSVAFDSRNGIIVSGASDGQLRLWDAKDGHAIGQPLQVPGPPAAVNSVAVSADGTMIASGSSDGKLRVWAARHARLAGDARNDKTPWDAIEVCEAKAKINGVAFSPDARLVVAGSSDGTLQLCDVNNRGLIGVPIKDSTSKDSTPEEGTPKGRDPTGISSVAFSPDGSVIVSASSNGTLRKWDVKTHEPVNKPLKGHTGSVNAVAFSPDGQLIASASSDKTLRLWDAQTGLPIGQPLQGHGKPVRGVAFSPNADRIVSVSDDMSLRVWPVDIPHDIKQAEQRAASLCPLDRQEREDGLLVDPMTPVDLPLRTLDQQRACGELDKPAGQMTATAMRTETR